MANYIVAEPINCAMCNIYCVSGTPGGYMGPSNLYSYLDPNAYHSNIIRIHTSSDLKLCVDETVEVIKEFNTLHDLPILLIGWSQGGYTIIKAVENLQNTQYLRKIMALIIISSKPVDINYVNEPNIVKYIVCGTHDTERRLNGSIDMYNNAHEPKYYNQIKNGTHNFEYDECFIELCKYIHAVILNEISRLV